MVMMLGLVVCLAGCSTFFVNESLSDSHVSVVTPQLEQDCTADGYFDTLHIDKTLSFERDEATSSYMLDVPEWCMRLQASAPSIEHASGDVTQN